MFDTYTWADMNQILEEVFAFAHGYWFCSGSDSQSQLTLAVGINNLPKSNYYLPEDEFTYEYGSSWGDMVVNLQDRLHTTGVCDDANFHGGIGCLVGEQVTVASSGDFEIGMNSAENTKAWIRGYLSQVIIPGGQNAKALFFNFGDAQGCAWDDPNDYDCDDQWWQSDLIYISDTCGACEPSPEIYFSNNADQWYYISLRENSSYGHKMTIHGVVTSDTACWQKSQTPDPNDDCESYRLTYEQSYRELYDVLDENEITRETTTELKYLTDMCWLDGQISDFCKR